MFSDRKRSKRCGARRQSRNPIQHQRSPLVPVLRPAVQAEDDIVARAGFGEVEVDPPRPHPAMADSLEVRRIGHCHRLVV
jgi:hypothetical protein